MWREISKAGVYLLNHTPRKRLRWKTPYEIFHSKAGACRKPDLTNHRAYSCKSICDNRHCNAERAARQALQPKAWIEYLVGYTSFNTYGIWYPALNKVVSIRYVICNEVEPFCCKLEAP